MDFSVKKIYVMVSNWKKEKMKKLKRWKSHKIMRQRYSTYYIMIIFRSDLKLY